MKELNNLNEKKKNDLLTLACLDTVAVTAS